MERIDAYFYAHDAWEVLVNVRPTPANEAALKKIDAALWRLTSYLGNASSAPTPLTQRRAYELALRNCKQADALLATLKPTLTRVRHRRVEKLLGQILVFLGTSIAEIQPVMN
jgi:hypothetical protein